MGVGWVESWILISNSPNLLRIYNCQSMSMVIDPTVKIDEKMGPVIPTQQLAIISDPVADSNACPSRSTVQIPGSRNDIEPWRKHSQFLVRCSPQPSKVRLPRARGPHGLPAHYLPSFIIFIHIRCMSAMNRNPTHSQQVITATTSCSKKLASWRHNDSSQPSRAHLTPP